MTYNGATAGSTSMNPPILALSPSWNGSILNSPGLTGGKVWYYTSTNVAADLTAPGAIADGYALGMRTGDLLLGVTAAAGSSSPICYMGVVGLQSSGTSASSPWMASSGVSLSSNVLTSTAV
jgi:hypothetical protein